MREMVKACNLTKTFTLNARQRKREGTDQKKKTAVKDLSFTVCEGEIFGLLGANGAGKTTTLRLLATLISPDTGTALVDGCDILSEPESVRKKIAFLTSDLKLEGCFTPNYLYDYFSCLHRVPSGVAAERKKEFFGIFGIDRFAEVKVENLSTGMRQKLSIVISLVHYPDVIIFDEPTNGLDVLTARTVTDFLRKAQAENKTIILSTHIFSLAEKICDRVGVMIDGQMAVCDTLGAVLDGLSLEERFFTLVSERAGEDR